MVMFLSTRNHQAISEVFYGCVRTRVEFYPKLLRAERVWLAVEGGYTQTAKLWQVVPLFVVSMVPVGLHSWVAFGLVPSHYCEAITFSERVTAGHPAQEHTKLPKLVS